MVLPLGTAITRKIVYFAEGLVDFYLCKSARRDLGIISERFLKVPVQRPPPLVLQSLEPRVVP